MIRYFASLFFGWLGLGLTISLLSGLAWLLVPRIPWVTERLRHLLLIVCICSAFATIAFAKGVHTGTMLYRAKIEREIHAAIEKGNEAKERALREFDASPDLPDDGFARD